MLKIKLTRTGRKNQAQYRIVVAEAKSKITGSSVVLGSYNPASTDNKIIINQQEYANWLSKGAQPTDTVRQLVKKLSWNNS